jgi:CRP-like cAMP-binding protein
MTSLGTALRASIWARTLEPQELSRVEKEILERAVPAGGYVCRKGEPVNHWIGVIDGLLKLGTVSAEGKPATLTGVPAGGWFGEGSLLKSEPRRYDAVALRDTRVALMPRATFGQKVEVSQEEIGYLSGISRQRVNQALRALEKDGLLRVEYGGVTILDLEGLRKR